MADSNIGSLPRAQQVDDESLLLMEQQGHAMNFSGRQLKNYAVSALELNFSDDIKKADEAADRARDSAESIINMIVDAHKSEEATVAKSMQDNKVKLDFGLPKGDKGDQGEVGPIGPRGRTGSGLTIIGHYGSEKALKDSVKFPEPGDAYAIGEAAPYDVYIYDGVTGEWRNYGPIAVNDNTNLPDNVVITDGGGELLFSAALGNSPFTVKFTSKEEEPALTADDIEYNGATLKDTLEQLFTSVDNGKDLIASAITDKGVDTEKDATFQQMADNIRKIESGGDDGGDDGEEGIDPSDATATPGDILAGKTAYTASGKVEGIIPSIQARTITPSTKAQSIEAGNYIAGTQIIRGDPNLQPSNIRKGVTLFDVNGAMETTFKATLTVTVDAGAVVTATHSEGEKVEALSTTGTVTMELPLEGQWTVTAQRGFAQYNSIVVNVSSNYNAALTADVHIKYFGTATAAPYSSDRFGLNVGDYAIYYHPASLYGNLEQSYVYAYNSYLVLSSAKSLEYPKAYVGLASNSKYAIFAGGRRFYLGSSGITDTQSTYCDAYDESLAKVTCQSLTYGNAVYGVSTDKYAIFAGNYQQAEAYNESLTKETTAPLIASASEANTYSACNKNYGIFYNNRQIVAYNNSLTREIAETPPASATGAATAGNYVVFFNADNMYAYDLFLTKTNVESAVASRLIPSSISLKGFALFCGGSNVSYPQNTSTLYKEVDVYDSYLTRTNPVELPVASSNHGGSSVGNYAILAGGIKISSNSYGPYLDSFLTTYVYQYV